MTSFSLNIPVKIKSECNTHTHWRDRYTRAKKQKAVVIAYWLNAAKKVQMPCTIKLIRRSPRKLDDDNLRGAFKAIRDALADLIIPGLAPGRADEQISWHYDQVKDKVQSVDVEVCYGKDFVQ